MRVAQGKRAVKATAVILACAACGTEVPYEARDCVGCGADVGFPNVRAADHKEEVEALRERVRYAQASATTRSCRAQLEMFSTATSQAQAVMTRNLAALDTFVNSRNQMMVSYYHMLRGGRLPEQNEFDQNRLRIDATINPFGVHENIQFAALSLDGRGVNWYGYYSITLRDSMIAMRTSVFEENPFKFCDKHHIPSKGSVPRGYRATWARRAELAIAKLHPKMHGSVVGTGFPAILVEQGVKSADSDFIEVHIYGVLHPRAIEHVVGPAPRKAADRVIWNRVKKRLVELGASVEEI